MVAVRTIIAALLSAVALMSPSRAQDSHAPNIGNSFSINSDVAPQLNISPTPRPSEADDLYGLIG